MKKINKLLNNKYILWCLVFLYGSLITIFMYYPTFSLDGYCQMSSPYNEYAFNFFVSGRFITALIWMFFDVINMPYDVLSVLAHLVSISILSMTVIKLYMSIKENIADELMLKIIALLGSILVFFNPFTQGILVFEESFCIAIAIYIATTTALKLADDISKKNIRKAIVLMVCTNFLYQGAICYFLPIVFLKSILNNKNKKFISYLKENYKHIFIYLLVFGASSVIAFLSLQIYVELTPHQFSTKVGKISLITNLSIILSLIKKTDQTMFSMINPIIFRSTYYILSSLIITRVVINLKKDYSKLIYVTGICLLAVLSPFIPNIVMKTSQNYTAPRLLLPYGGLIGFLLIGALLLYEKREKKLNRFFYLLMLIPGIYFFINCSTMTFYNSHNDYLRYKSDVEYINVIKNEIANYEKQTKNKINIVYFTIKDIERPNYRSKYYNINHIRVCSSTWGMKCAIRGFIDREYRIRELREEKYQQMIENGKNIDFDKNRIYIIFK